MQIGVFHDWPFNKLQLQAFEGLIILIHTIADKV